HEFPVDIDPALDWLKSRPRIDTRKIVIIGSDVGANLALIASGRFPEVRTAVAINPKLDESLALAGSAHDFQPRSTLVIVRTRLKAIVLNRSSNSPHVCSSSLTPVGPPNGWQTAK